MGYIILILLIFYLLKKNANLKVDVNNYRENRTYDKINISMPYKLKHILTNNEYNFYKILKPITDKHGYLICPKVGIKDIVDITSRHEYRKWFAKVSQKHIDFLICDSNLKPLFAIELDDSSHTREKAIINDTFKNNLFIDIGLPLKRVISNRYENLEEYLFPK